MDLLSRDNLRLGAPMKRAWALLFLIESRVTRLAARDQQIEAWLAAPVWGEAAPISSFPLPLDDAQPDEEDLLKPFAEARSPRPRPRIRQIERYAPEWASLVSENPRLRAAVAHLLGERYGKLPRRAVGIRAALGLDREAVQQVYQALFGAPLETLYAPEITLRERLQWAWAALGRWLARVPAFWFAFAFTLTETVGAGILALPIAMAKAGPLAGAAILVFLGAINVVTVVCMAEAAARSDVIRCGDGFLGRLVADYLGRTGSLVFTAGGATLSLLWLQVYYAGFASFMAEAVPLPPPVWAGVLFAACLYFATRPSLRSTATSALIVGAVNLLLILALLTFAFGHLQPEHLRLGGLPLRDGEGFDASILQMVFGVGLAAYFGHFSVGNCARLVLRRDPTARGLIGGSATAQVVAMVLYTLFVIGTSGAVGSQALADYPGTALEPLARLAGPAVLVLGAAYATLAMGMAAVHHSLGLFNLVLERLPIHRAFPASLVRGGGRLILEARGSGQGPRIGLAHAGLVNGRPVLRVDVQVDGRFGSCDFPVPAGEGGEAERVRLDATQLWERLPSLCITPKDGKHRRELIVPPLHVEVVAAGEEEIRLAVSSPMRARYEAERRASLARLFEVPDAQWPLVALLARRGEASSDEVAAALKQDAAATRASLEALAAEGIVEERGSGAETRFSLGLTRRQARRLPKRIWEALDTSPAPKTRAPAAEDEGPRAAMRLTEASRRDAKPPSRWRPGRRAPRTLLLAATPLLGSFLLTEWLLIRESQSFAGLLSFMGVLLVSLLGGFFPVWLLAAGRRKGAILPGAAPRLLGNPLVMAVVYTTFLLALLVHGLFIWESLPARAAALASAALSLGATALLVRRGAFSPRIVIELRELNASHERLREPLGRDQAEHGDAESRGKHLGEEESAVAFSVMANGQPLPVTARIDRPGDTREIRSASGPIGEAASLQRLTLSLPAISAREIKLWTHRQTPEGASEPLSVIASIRREDETWRMDMGLCHGQVLLPLPPGTSPMTVTFKMSDELNACRDGPSGRAVQAQDLPLQLMDSC